MVPPHRAPFRGRLRGRLRGREHGTRTAGGVSQEQPGGVSHPPLPCFAVVVRVCRPRPADPNRASGEGRDGSDPPFFTASAVRQRGGCPTQCPTGCPIPPRRWGGRSRLYVSLREGSPARVRAGRRAETSGPMLDRLIRAFLVVSGVSVACAWTWPGAFPEADPVAVLVRYHTPNAYRAAVAWYYVAPGVAAFPGRAISHLHIPDLVRPDGHQFRAPVPPSEVAAFAYGGRPGDRRRRGPSPGQSHREPGSRMADNPGAGPLYRRGDFRRGRVRQDVRLYAPVRAPTLRLASDESRAARGGAGPGSEGRFLPRHPPDADRAGPGRGLHRAVP